MTEKQVPKPVKKQAQSGQASPEMQAKRAKNLRDNLLKRKAQQRARATKTD
jgi:hypothetical protein